jgi:hypothetical protein
LKFIEIEDVELLNFQKISLETNRNISKLNWAEELKILPGNPKRVNESENEEKLQNKFIEDHLSKILEKFNQVAKTGVWNWEVELRKK